MIDEEGEQKILAHTNDIIEVGSENEWRGKYLFGEYYVKANDVGGTPFSLQYEGESLFKDFSR